MMEVGFLDVCLKVDSLEKSLAFYKALGFKVKIGSIDDGFIYITNGVSELGLFSKYISKNLLNFRGGNPFEIEKVLESSNYKMKESAQKEDDGSNSAYIEDPDGNLIYFNTCANDIKTLAKLRES